MGEKGTEPPLVRMICTGCHYQLQDGTTLLAKHRQATEMLLRKLQYYSTTIPEDPLDLINFVKEKEPIHSTLHRYHYLYFHTYKYTSQFIERFLNQENTSSTCCDTPHRDCCSTGPKDDSDTGIDQNHSHNHSSNSSNSSSSSSSHSHSIAVSLPKEFC